MLAPQSFWNVIWSCKSVGRVWFISSTSIESLISSCGLNIHLSFLSHKKQNILPTIAWNKHDLHSHQWYSEENFSGKQYPSPLSLFCLQKAEVAHDNIPNIKYVYLPTKSDLSIWITVLFIYPCPTLFVKLKGYMWVQVHVDKSLSYILYSVPDERISVQTMSEITQPYSCQVGGGHVTHNSFQL